MNLYDPKGFTALGKLKLIDQEKKMLQIEVKEFLKTSLWVGNSRYHYLVEKIRWLEERENELKASRS